MQNHPVPQEYHALFAIGKKDRRDNIIDFKIPPVIVESPVPIDEYRSTIFRDHISDQTLPMIYTQPSHFIVLRPSALSHRIYVREELQRSNLHISEEFELNNFMKFADIVYLLDPEVSFHWKWRVIMRTLHDSGLQEQNKAVVFLFKDHINNGEIMDIKKRIRITMGETPVLVRYNGNPEIALGIHHLHAPDDDRLPIEYNVLMHARYKTSVFS